MKTGPREIKLPRAKRCGICKTTSEWQLVNTGTVRENEFHTAECPHSEYQKKIAACKASGGHDYETVSAGQHSFDQCTKCGRIS